MTAIDKVKASKAKCKRHRDNWKSRALEQERENAELRKLCKEKINEIPRSWLNSVFIYAEKTIGKPPYDYQQIAALLTEIRKRADTRPDRGMEYK